MSSPPSGGEWRAGALALALVLHAETIQKIKRLAMPHRARQGVIELYGRLCEVHRLCTDLEAQLREESTMAEKSKFAPMQNRFWTAQGANDRDPPINVGIFSTERDSARWCARQNETQRQQEWGRGSAGPMNFVPKPLYGTPPSGGVGAPDPQDAVYPIRQWDEPEDEPEDDRGDR